MIKVSTRSLAMAHQRQRHEVRVSTSDKGTRMIKCGLDQEEPDSLEPRGCSVKDSSTLESLVILLNLGVSWFATLAMVIRVIHYVSYDGSVGA